MIPSSDTLSITIIITTATFTFCLTGLLFHSYSRLGQVFQKEKPL